MSAARARARTWTVLAALVAATHLQAQASPSVSLGGYVRSLTGGLDLGYETGFSDRRSAFNGEVVRLKWLIEVGDQIRVSVHNRLQMRITSSASSQNVLGFGVSIAPNRTVDLVTTVVDGEHVRVWHDLDRLAATFFLDAADLTVGRQAIAWGNANLFPVADLWAQFSPFELDTEEKPGVDAVRALIYPAGGVEVDAVVADRGTRRDLSAGVRITVGLPVADVYVAAGKFWRELIVLGGASVVVDTWKVRGEVAVPYEMDADDLRAVRATAGVDWISGDAQASIEYHYNGLGTTSSDDYLTTLNQPERQRGETYYLGRHYLGAIGAYLATDRVSLSLGALANLDDWSAAVLPTVTMDVGQSVRIGIGGLLSAGARPMFPTGELPQLMTEFGTYGHFGYVQASMYF